MAEGQILRASGGADRVGLDEAESLDRLRQRRRREQRARNGVAAEMIERDGHLSDRMHRGGACGRAAGRCTLAQMKIADVRAAELELIGPKANSTHGAPVESGLVLFEDEHGRGRDLGDHRGRLRLDQGRDLGGHALRLRSRNDHRSRRSRYRDRGRVWCSSPPDGWSGVWDVREPTRKTYTIVKTIR